MNKYTLGIGSSEYLRHVAISRIFFDNIEHIQVHGQQWEQRLRRWRYLPVQMTSALQ